MVYNDIIEKFNSAQSGNPDARKSIIDYFMDNVDKQLENCNLTPEQKADRSIKCRKSIVQNLGICFEYEDFFQRTMESIKNIIYLYRPPVINNSRDLISNQNTFKTIVTIEDIDSLDLPIVVRETARLYFVENKSVSEISALISAKEVIICRRLMLVKRKIAMKKMSNSIKNEEMLVYNK